MIEGSQCARIGNVYARVFRILYLIMTQPTIVATHIVFLWHEKVQFVMRVEVFLQSAAIKILRQKLSQASFSAGESRCFPFYFK